MGLNTQDSIESYLQSSQCLGVHDHASSVQFAPMPASKSLCHPCLYVTDSKYLQVPLVQNNLLDECLKIIPIVPVLVPVLVPLKPHLRWVWARCKRCHPKQMYFLLSKDLRKLIPLNGIRVIWPVCGISLMSASIRLPSDQCPCLSISTYHASNGRILFYGPSARPGIPCHLLCPSDTIFDDLSLRDMTPHLSCVHFSVTTGSRACSASGNKSG